MAGRRRIARRLFAALDGSSLVVSGDRWRLTVYSVSEQAGELWVQAGASGRAWRMLTVRLARDGAVSDAFRTLAWLLRPYDSEALEPAWSSEHQRSARQWA